MNCKIYRGIIFILAIASIWQLATAVGDILEVVINIILKKIHFFIILKMKNTGIYPESEKQIG